MLYYICAMHTFFTWMVYLALYVGNQFNENDVFCAAKILITLAITAVLYDVDGVFHFVFKCAPPTQPRRASDAPRTRPPRTHIPLTRPASLPSLYRPFGFLLDFHDPLHPEFTDALHEWFFRSGLDHVVWVRRAARRAAAPLQHRIPALPPARVRCYLLH